MEERRPNKKLIRKKIKKKSWIEKNLKYITILFLFLFVIQSFRGCTGNMTHRTETVNLTDMYDSLLSLEKNRFESEHSMRLVLVDSIKTLQNDLKIESFRASAADQRAAAVQRTAERVKNNNITTIKIEADTTQNKIRYDGPN